MPSFIRKTKQTLDLKPLVQEPHVLHRTPKPLEQEMQGLGDMLPPQDPAATNTKPNLVECRLQPALGSVQCRGLCEAWERERDTKQMTLMSSGTALCRTAKWPRVFQIVALARIKANFPRLAPHSRRWIGVPGSRPWYTSQVFAHFMFGRQTANCNC